jgi:hypothetical protein
MEFHNTKEKETRTFERYFFPEVFQAQTLNTKQRAL